MNVSLDLDSAPTEALAACPMCHSREILGGEASELRALFFDHVPAMSVSGFATAACAGDCGVEWHGNGRIAGHSALYGLSTPRLLQLEAIVDEILIASLKASHTTGSRDSKEQK